MVIIPLKTGLKTKNSRIIIQKWLKTKNVIKDLAKNHTVIIVAHRLSTIVDSDNIFVLDKHKISASGTHNELMKNCAEYRNLYEIEE